MKERIQGMLMGSIITVLLLSTVTVLANAVTRNISVTFGNIRIVVDGEQITPRDGAGNIVQPFVFEGTTYLPVRAVGEALDLPVHWDGATSTVYIGSRTPMVHLPEPTPTPMPTPAPPVYTWLDHMPHLNHQREGFGLFSFSSWTPGRRSEDGTAFDRGLRFSMGGGFQSIDVELNSNYNTFRGMLVSDGAGANQTQVRFYGDGRLLYTSPVISRGTIPISFNVDVSNVQFITIHVAQSGAGNVGHNIGIVNARFERNQ